MKAEAAFQVDVLQVQRAEAKGPVSKSSIQGAK